MNKNVTILYNIKRFTNQCFDKDNDKVAGIIKGILDAKSSRISDISSAMDRNPDTKYKRDLKNLLLFEKIMNKNKINMEKMIA